MENRCFRGFELLLVIVYILHGMPIIGYYFPSVLFATLVFVLTLLLLLKTKGKHHFPFVFLFGIPCVTVLLHVFSASDIMYILKEISGLFQTMMYAMIAYVLIIYKDVKQAKVILGVYYLTSLITCVTTGYGCTVFPGAARLLATGDESVISNYELFMKANIDGFSFVYTMILTMPTLVYLIRNKRLIHSFLWCMSVFFYLAIWYMIIKTEYTTALLIGIIYVSLFFIRSYRYSKDKLLVLVSVLVVLICVGKPIISSGLMYFADQTGSIDVSDRLRDLSLKIDGKETDSAAGDLEDRTDRSLLSFRTFINNPLGTWSEKSQIGWHSYLFDNMALFGLLGVLMILLMLITINKYYVLIYADTNIFNYSVFAFLGFIILLIVNPGAFYAPLTFTLPLTKMCIDNSSL